MAGRSRIHSRKRKVLTDHSGQSSTMDRRKRKRMKRTGRLKGAGLSASSMDNSLSSDREHEQWDQAKEDDQNVGEQKSNQQSRQYQRTKRRLYFDDEISPGPEVTDGSNRADRAAREISGKDQKNTAGRIAGSAAEKAAHAAAGAADAAALHDVQESDDKDELASAGRAAGQTGRLLIRTVSDIHEAGKGQKSQALREHGNMRLQEKKQGEGRFRFLSFQDEEDAIDPHKIRSLQQKKRIQKTYAQAYRKAGKDAAAYAWETAPEEIRRPAGSGILRKVQDFVRSHAAVITAAAASVFLLVGFASGLGTFGSMFAESGGAFVESTYLSSDDAIREADEIYEEMEEALQEKISRMEETHPGYDEYRYQIDEIDHDPYHLASYLTAKYGVYTKAQVKEELKDLFAKQYNLSTQSETVTETVTRTVRVGESLGKVVTSGYCNCTICCGRWAGGPTASGKYPKADHTIAVDAGTPFVPMGTHVVMNGHEYVVEDTGAFARYGVHFDVYYDSHSAASSHGHKKWEAYLADSNGKKEVEVKERKTIRRLNVKLTSKSLDGIFRTRLNEEQLRQYDIYNMTYGNRDYLFPVASLPDPDGMSYNIPPEALSDKRFARMIKEAEKYLGYPYVWGGSRPSTSFDCSGFVSWVINHCGNGWNYGRRTAEGLRKVCTYVAPSQAKPGDLIFFKGTYNTSGASHIGIYVGNNKMIHCGNPIKYASINTTYWKKHFWCFGRLP